MARNDDNQVRVWDAATGEPVTPMLGHTGYVRLAQVMADDRLVTLSLPNILRAWGLEKWDSSTEVLTDHARLLAGRSLTANGVMLVMGPHELAELCRSFGDRVPKLFTR